MGKKDPATVEAPDPYEAAQADALFNRIDQYGPGYSLTFSGPERNRADITLSPELQRVFDMRLQTDADMMQQAQNVLANYNPEPIDLSQFGPIRTDAGLQEFDPSGLNLPDIPTDLEGYRSSLEDALMSRMTRLVNPQFEQAQRQMDDTLANRGFFEGDEAWLEQSDLFNTNRFNTYADIAERAVLGSGQEITNFLAQALGARGQLFNEGLTSNQAINATRQQGLLNQNTGRTQGLNEALALYGDDFNRLASFLGLQQVQTPTMQNFFAPGQADYMGALGLNQQAQQYNANASNAMNMAGLQGLYGLGSAAITGGLGAYGSFLGKE